MRNVVRAIVTIVASVGLVTTMAVAPSQAAKLDLSRNGYKCTANVFKPSLAAEATMGSCSAVQVRVTYVDYGQVRYGYGSRGSYSYEAAGNSTGFTRAVSATISNGFSSWKTY